MTQGIDNPTAADAGAISAVAEASFRATFGHLYPPHELDEFLTEWMPPAKVAAQIEGGEIIYRVVRDDAGVVSGYIKLGPVDFDLPASEPDTVDALELHQLYLAQAAQGTGAAARLMDWCLEEARSRGAKRLYLSVFIDNIRAQRFYARYGFYEVGKLGFRVGNTVDDDRIWRCDL